ncbi:hypothetical protein UPYG_G00300190 [Umbra pygmaea]|uniref:RGS domain-containing protein n=1 Tax=Umbra pygmaea TaxID=75934 RepID=A0ABD0WMN0_UMBPY
MELSCMMTSEKSSKTKRLLHNPLKNRLHIFIHNPLLPTRKTMHIENVDEIKQLEQSLEKLLTHKNGRAAFHVFLKTQFCEENLEFWQACEEFKSITSLKKLARKATRIYNEFIQNDSPKEVNVDFYTRDTIAQNLHQPSPFCFDSAQKKVYSLMENDAYPRFIQSDFFKDLQSDRRSMWKHKRA